ncbi:META domain-containing protein [Alsobacter sp. R-9]
MRRLPFGLVLLAAVLAMAPARAHSEPPKALTQAAWVVEDIGGKGIVDRSRPTIAFSAEGAVSGSGSCNRFMGGFALHDANLSFTPLASTQMACPEALMKQEQAYFALLSAVTRYEIDATGALRLFTADGQSITARR